MTGNPKETTLRGLRRRLSRLNCQTEDTFTDNDQAPPVPPLPISTQGVNKPLPETPLPCTGGEHPGLAPVANAGHIMSWDKLEKLTKAVDTTLTSENTTATLANASSNFDLTNPQSLPAPPRRHRKTSQVPPLKQDSVDSTVTLVDGGDNSRPGKSKFVF